MSGSASSALRRTLMIGLVGGALILALQLPQGSSAYSGLASCSGGTCNFCLDVTLHSYGAQTPDLGDRCAYGYFVGANQVENIHSSGQVYMCAGMKSASNGGGNNVGPVGVTCVSSTYDVLTPYDGDTAGYATIINHDGAPHYHFYGHAEY